MKQCPKCGRTYDDSQSFCLMDGTPLAVESETETIARQPPPSSERKKSRLLLWFGLTALVVITGAISVAGILIYKFRSSGENAAVNRNAKVTASPSPTAKTTPTATASPTVKPSPKTEESKSTSDDDETDADEITPIAWNTSAVAFKSDVGQTYKFQCPADGTASSIWGSDVYTQDSSICTAAVHAGLFTLESGGVVTIEFRPGRQTYGSTVRNGITSNSFGEYSHSFVVR